MLKRKTFCGTKLWERLERLNWESTNQSIHHPIPFSLWTPSMNPKNTLNFTEKNSDFLFLNYLTFQEYWKSIIKRNSSKYLRYLAKVKNLIAFPIICEMLLNFLLQPVNSLKILFYFIDFRFHFINFSFHFRNFRFSFCNIYKMKVPNSDFGKNKILGTGT